MDVDWDTEGSEASEYWLGGEGPVAGRVSEAISTEEE